MGIDNIVIAVITAIVSIAFSYGIIRTEVTAMKDQIKDTVRREEFHEAKENLKQCVRQDSCAFKHERIDSDFGKIDCKLDRIEGMLMELLKK